ncbi:MAG: tol-pal system protein YbgF [Pseudomonadota bacterium]
MMQRKASTVLLSAALLGGCSVLTPPAEDPAVVARFAALDQRIEALERVVRNQSLATMTQEVRALERRVDELRGTDEAMQYNAETTAERQRSLYADLDARLAALEAGLRAVSSGGGSLGEGDLPVPGGSDKDNYQAALELLKEQQYAEAGMAFDNFLKTFPDSDLAHNAQYWLAETYYAGKEFETAVRAFERVVDEYPDSSKVPDALLKMGFCNYELQQFEDARASLTRVQSEYPETTAARLAGQRLERMSAEGV